MSLIKNKSNYKYFVANTIDHSVKFQLNLEIMFLLYFYELHNLSPHKLYVNR